MNAAAHQASMVTAPFHEQGDQSGQCEKFLRYWGGVQPAGWKTFLAGKKRCQLNHLLWVGGLGGCVLPTAGLDPEVPQKYTTPHHTTPHTCVHLGGPPRTQHATDLSLCAIVPSDSFFKRRTTWSPNTCNPIRMWPGVLRPQKEGS